MATITSTQTGNWHATSTWVGGSIPANNDLVVIAHGHKVTLSTDIQSAITDDVTINGNLHFADGGKMHLNGRMTVKNTSNANNTAGEFVTNSTSSGSLLSMVAGSEIKISGDNSAQHGIQVDSRAWCGVDIDGGEPTLKTELNGNHAQRSTYLTVDNSANFAVGDLISLYLREDDYRLSNDECVWVHDIDTSNHRIYFKQFVSPKVNNYEPCIKAVNGSTITVDDSSVFRVGYQLIFGTGTNRNVLEITAINNRTNVITFGSTVDGDPSLIGDYVCQTGTEKYHLNNTHVRRTSSCMTNTYSGATSLRTVNVNNAADFNVGDHIYIEACGDASYQYASGSETNVWRHNLMYKITGISGLTITVDRDILYDGKAGGLISRMTRGVVIKACAANGDDVADGDQDTARVFFNVKYWTSNGWNAAPTRRVKIKYVQFLGLGYNTNDSTNFRSGVNIAGYNGINDTKITGSAADNSTIHSTNAVTQTGENYIDGCSFSSYNLYSNSTRDGDDYGSITSRHPYGIVLRNLIVIGAGRGVWCWSTQYYIKSHGHITAAQNYTSYHVDSTYERGNEHSYMYLRMAEDYGWIFYHLGRQNDFCLVQHFDIQYQNSYAIHPGYASNSTVRRIYCDKYRYMYVPDSFTPMTFQDSQFMPNYWDASTYIYNPNPSHTPYYSVDYVRHYSSGHLKPYLGTSSNTGRWDWIEHGFREGEYVDYGGGGITRLVTKDSKVAEYMVSPSGTPQIMNRIFVPANTAVRLRSKLKINEFQYDGGAETIPTNGMPCLIARGRCNSGMFGRHGYGVVTDNSVRTGHVDADLLGDSADQAGNKTSTENKGKIFQNSFVDLISHTSSSQGAFETKELTVAAQYTGYELAYGYYVDDHNICDVGFKAEPIQVFLEKPDLASHLHSGSIGRKSIRSSFTANKKRISGRI